MTTDITVEILRDIRDGVRETNSRIDVLRDDLSARIDALRDEFAQRLDQTNERLANVEHGLNDLGKFMRQIALDQAKDQGSTLGGSGGQLSPERRLPASRGQLSPPTRSTRFCRPRGASQ